MRPSSAEAVTPERSVISFTYRQVSAATADNRDNLPAACRRWRTGVHQYLQRRRRVALIYLGVVAAVLVLVTVLVLVVWVLPTVLTEHPHIPKSVDRHKAITDTRTGLVAMLVAIGAAGGLAYTARTYALSRAGQITDRYSKAIEQLGSDALDVRLGGIYALERLAYDSRRKKEQNTQNTIVEVLSAFTREH